MAVQNIIDGHTLHTLQIYIYVGKPLSSFALGKYLNIKNFFFFFLKRHARPEGGFVNTYFRFLQVVFSRGDPLRTWLRQNGEKAGRKNYFKKSISQKILCNV